MVQQSESQGEFTVGRATRFYVPLLLQAVSQSLTYPLMAAIVSHGANGVKDYTAFALGQTVMFMIGALGGGLITTGMVFGRDRVGFHNFKRLNIWMAAAMTVLQLLVCLPGIDRFVFHVMLGLPDPLWPVARNTLMMGQVMQIGFFLRNVPFVALYNARNSAAANMATIFRILLTALLSPVFVWLGWVGPRWGVVAMTGPVLLEMALAYRFALPYIRQLPEGEPGSARLRAQLAFTLPLSFGGFLLATAPSMIGIFIGHSADSVQMYAIHIVTIGLANPVGFAALRMQSVVIAYPPRFRGDTAVFRFGLFSGILLALPLFLLQIPFISDWYFVRVQNLAPERLGLARQVMLLFTLLPIFQSMRGYAEGLAACFRRPNAILAGQAMNLASLVCTLAITLHIGMRGCFMGVTSVVVACFLTFVTVRLGVAYVLMEPQFGKGINR